MNTNYQTITTTLDALRPHPAQMRTVLDVEDTAQLTLQIYEQGLDPTRPIVVARDGSPDTFLVVSGHRRWLALMLALELRAATDPGGKKADLDDARRLVQLYAGKDGGLLAAYDELRKTNARVPVTVALFEGDGKDQVLELLSHNYGQAEADAVGKALAFRAAVKAGASVPQVARRIGQHRHYVENHLGLLDLSETLRGLIAGGELPLGIAQPIARLPKHKRAAMDRLIVEHKGQYRSITVRLVKDGCRAFAGWDGFQPPLTAERPDAYHKGRIVAALWAKRLEETPDDAWYLGAWYNLQDQKPNEKRLLQALAPDYILTEGRYEWQHEPNWNKLLQDLLPEVGCANCPLARLPADLLHTDLDKARYPCRQKGGAIPPRCLNAPLDGAPFRVETPWQWKQAASLADYFVSSEADLLRAYEAVRQHEATVVAKADPVLGEVAPDDGPMTKQRALIAHYLANHTGLNHKHPLAAACERCRWQLDESPTQDPDVPHCEWARRLRTVEFLVRAPAEGEIGTAIPVCRQFMAKDGVGWAERIPEHDGDLAVPRAWLLRQVERLARQVHLHTLSGQANGRRTVLETLTGRPLVKSEDHGPWFVVALGREQSSLTDRQVYTLFLWMMAEWEAMGRQASSAYGETYQLLVVGRPVAYRDQKWTSYWRDDNAQGSALDDLDDDQVDGLDD